MVCDNYTDTSEKGSKQSWKKKVKTSPDIIIRLTKYLGII